MNEKTEKFLSVRGLDVVYTSGRKTVHAVNGISFDMDKGETLALVGETGAGKTTIAKAILGILPNPPAQAQEWGNHPGGRGPVKKTGGGNAENPG